MSHGSGRGRDCAGRPGSGGNTGGGGAVTCDRHGCAGAQPWPNAGARVPLLASGTPIRTALCGTSRSASSCAHIADGLLDTTRTGSAITVGRTHATACSASMASCCSAGDRHTWRSSCRGDSAAVGVAAASACAAAPVGAPTSTMRPARPGWSSAANAAGAATLSVFVSAAAAKSAQARSTQSRSCRWRSSSQRRMQSAVVISSCASAGVRPSKRAAAPSGVAAWWSAAAVDSDMSVCRRRQRSAPVGLAASHACSAPSGSCRRRGNDSAIGLWQLALTEIGSTPTAGPAPAAICAHTGSNHWSGEVMSRRSKSSGWLQTLRNCAIRFMSVLTLSSDMVDLPSRSAALILAFTPSYIRRCRAVK